MRGIIFILAFLSFISLSSAALICTPNPITYSIRQDQSPSSVTVTCFFTPSVSVPQVNLSASTDVFSTNPNLPISFDSQNLSRTIQLSFIQKPVGYYPSYLFATDGTVIPVNYTVTNPPAPSCEINPSLISYYQSVQQGTTLTLPKIIFNPTNCDGSLTLSASTVTIQGGIITTAGQKPVYISSIESNGINLMVDTTGLNSQQTYTSNLNIQAFSKTFTIPFNIVVTAGVTPATNFSLANLPQCSLTSNILNLNSTYNLVCNNMQPDVSVQPDVDNTYLVGTGLDSSSTTFIWHFQPITFGSTKVKAKFFYRNAPVGAPFSQDVSIQSSGYIIPGTNLKVTFYPDLSQARENQVVTLQIVDNISNNLVSNGVIQIDSQAINQSGSNFYFSFLASKNYTLRAIASGYNDLVQTVALQLKPIYINITPNTGDDVTIFNINTDVNATLYLDSNKITNPYYGTITFGDHLIKAEREGYYTTSKNISIIESVKISETPYPFESGNNFLAMLNKNSSFEVTFQKDISSEISTITSGNGTRIAFTPNKGGFYTITANNRALQTYELKKSWFASNWYYILAGAGVLFFIVIIIRNRNDSAPISGMSIGGLSGG